MTSLLEKAISIIAPHRCFSCSKEGNVLCDACFFDVFDEPCELCFLCNKPTNDSRVCPSCKPFTAIEHVWMAGTYDGLRRELIRSYKFERKRAAYVPLSRAVGDALPYLSEIVVVPVPTAAERIRIRGYDQARLLAKELTRNKGWIYADALRRLHGQRQVGASRTGRIRQADRAYEIARSKLVAGKHVLLVDDVTTSGATLNAAARCVAGAGALRIDAAVVAKHTLRQG